MNKETKQQSGRPRIYDESLKMRAINLTSSDVEFAKKLGHGNMADGVRAALEIARAVENVKQG